MKSYIRKEDMCYPGFFEINSAIYCLDKKLEKQNYGQLKIEDKRKILEQEMKKYLFLKIKISRKYTEEWDLRNLTIKDFVIIYNNVFSRYTRFSYSARDDYRKSMKKIICYVLHKISELQKIPCRFIDTDWEEVQDEKYQNKPNLYIEKINFPIDWEENEEKYEGILTYKTYKGTPYVETFNWVWDYFQNNLLVFEDPNEPARVLGNILRV